MMIFKIYNIFHTKLTKENIKFMITLKLFKIIKMLYPKRGKTGSVN